MKELKENISRLNHILDAIEEIEQYTKGLTLDDFIASSLVFNASVRQVAIIGEASARLSEHLRDAYPDIPWRQIIGMRNILVHDYFGISIHFVWSTIENDLPKLKSQIKTILNQLD
ncbi:MAG: DUF86 domain-containing protein [Saprospiraceae bacterium]|nr:DUF86 domain-containing protein [Saprospiraceae bacterium]